MIFRYAEGQRGKLSLYPLWWKFEMQRAEQIVQAFAGPPTTTGRARADSSGTMVGKKVAHFEIIDKLAEGGMGAVYKARDFHLNRLVAIKALLRETMSNPDRRRRFAQEAKAASALNHPNIITMYNMSNRTVPTS